MKKIIIALLLCFVFVMPLFTACGNDENIQATEDNPADPDGVNSGEAGAETKDPDAPDLPKVDMEGKVFTFLTANWGSGEKSLSRDISGEEQTGDPVDDAGYARRIKIEQEYNVKIREVLVEGADPAVAQYRTTILSGDGSYDAGVTTCTNFSSLLTGNCLVDWKELLYVDMDKPYWNKNFYDTMSILGKNYAADGDISKRRLECVWIMAFNKDIIKENNFEIPYDLVKNGQWTYFKMHEMAKGAAKDVNGDGVMDLRGEDVWGLNYTGDTIVGIINSSGIRIAQKDSDGVPELTVGSEANLEKLLRIYTDMRDHTYSIDTLFKVGGGLNELGDIDIFSENRCLFLACATHNVSRSTDTSSAANNTRGLRDLEVDLGIIPYPKWDAAQTNYTPFTAGNYHPVLTIPQTNHDLDNTGIILEALSYEGMKNVSPAFYENLLKTKTARDNESEEMIDFIFGNINYDVGVMYDFGDMMGQFGYEASTNIRMNIVSTIEKNINKWEKAIDKLISDIQAND